MKKEQKPLTAFDILLSVIAGNFMTLILLILIIWLSGVIRP